MTHRDPSIWEPKKVKRCPHCGLHLSARRVTTFAHVNFYCKQRPADATSLTWDEIPDIADAPDPVAVVQHATHPREERAMTKITDTSLAVFRAYAADAGNWGGTPLVGGNVGGSKEERGNLTQLKRAGLITTFRDAGETWVDFTAAGRDLARELGIELL